MTKIIISCAITGSIHTPSMSPYLPITGAQIAAQAVEAAGVGAAMGGHVRVGLEDNLHIGKGVLEQSNAQQVRLIRGIVEDLGREVATPDEVRAMLGLKGADRVAF